MKPDDLPLPTHADTTVSSSLTPTALKRTRATLFHPNTLNAQSLAPRTHLIALLCTNLTLSRSSSELEPRSLSEDDFTRTGDDPSNYKTFAPSHVPGAKARSRAHERI
ncbi:hypothetical protein NMY22_g14973 [Coprinellus aureogranulatus]|nr:hypothetical protein NMY22_g14973 [Coprinellus aureogranulatus]